MKAESASQHIKVAGQSGWRTGRRFAASLLAFILHPSSFILAASAVSTPPPAPDIRGIVPPQPFYLRGDFWWLAVAGVCLLLAAFVLWEVLRPTKKPPVPLPNPLSAATQRLRELAARMDGMDPRTFGGAVCDVLRAYIGGEFGLAAERQTSPEFLASITGNRAFSVREHHLLAEFLDACDLLKFARADATLDRKRHLLAQATEFLENSSRPPLPGKPEVRMQNAEVRTL